MICTLCHRDMDTIIGSIVNKAKVTKNTVIDVFFKDSEKRIVCNRCTAEHALIHSCDGEPVVVYYAHTKKFMVNRRALKNAITEAVHLEENYVLARK